MADTPSVVRMATPQVPPLPSLLLASILCWYVVTGFFVGSPLSKNGQFSASPVLAAETQAADVNSETQSPAQTQLSHWLSLYQSQPTDRDVLINLALLYQAQGQPDQAKHFKDLAQSVDPNNPVINTFFSGN